VSSSYLVVDESSDSPPYRQIVEQIRGAIESGAMTPGAPLPTVRQLASDLGVAPNTVARAYTELQDSGWLTSDGRRGTRVSDGPPRANGRKRVHILRDAVEEFVGSLLRRGFTHQDILVELQRTLE
jgi:DNA-binding transcriptional regulator YhcF (GntR family)